MFDYRQSCKKSHLHLAPIIYIFVTHNLLIINVKRKTQEGKRVFLLTYNRTRGTMFTNFSTTFGERDETRNCNLFKLVRWTDPHREDTIDVPMFVKQRREKFYLFVIRFIRAYNLQTSISRIASCRQVGRYSWLAIS